MELETEKEGGWDKWRVDTCAEPEWGGKKEEMSPSYLRHNIKPLRWEYKVWRDDGGGGGKVNLI